MAKKTSFRVVDLFAGAGGLSLGFHVSGFSTVFAVDYDKYSMDTFNENFNGVGICADIRTVMDFPSSDIVIGGPPCQGFSRLGKQAKLPRMENLLWKEYFRCIKVSNPYFFVIENVPDFFKDPAWLGVQESSRALGYSICAAILNAADYGVPQRRHRAIIIGSRISVPQLPDPTHRDPALLFPLHLPPWRTVRDAIADLPLIPNNVNRHDSRNVSAVSLERYSHVPPGGNRKNLPDHLQFDCWKNKDPRSGGSTDLMGRLRWDEPSLTIRTQFLKPEKGCYLHPEADRSLTVREGARLQTFPDMFRFVGSNFQVAKQIGNAVPFELARQIAMCTYRQLTSNLQNHIVKTPSTSLDAA